MPRRRSAAQHHDPTPSMFPCVLLITDPSCPAPQLRALMEAVGAIATRGTVGVQLRDKSATSATLGTLASSLRLATRELGMPFFVNGHPELAADVGADGAHVPVARVEEARARMGSAARITTPAHDEEELLSAMDAGASGALVSPIFATPGKGTPRGLGALTTARSLVDARRGGGFFLYALGGVDASSASACYRAGADGVAVVRALLTVRSDPSPEARAQLRAVLEGLVSDGAAYERATP